MVKIRVIYGETTEYLFYKREFFFILTGNMKKVAEENGDSFGYHNLVKYSLSQLHFGFFKTFIKLLELIALDKKVVFLEKFDKCSLFWIQVDL